MDASERELDGLTFEDQRLYGSASGDLDVFDLVNNPAASGVCRVFGPGFEEELSSVFDSDVRPVGDDRTYPLLVADDIVQALA